MQKTIADVSHGRNNNFNLLRFIAATMVIFSHAFWVTGSQPPLLTLTGLWDSGEIGVNIFFVISGFLIAQSYLQRHNLLAFLEARFLRIFPALWVALLFTVVVIGPLVTELSLPAYFTHLDTYKYPLQNATLITMDGGLTGIFKGNPVSGAANNSLWTLPYELRLYLLIALLGVLAILRQRKIFNLLFVFSLIFAFDWPRAYTLVGDEASSMVRLAAYFSLGSFLYINRADVPLHRFGVVSFAAAIWLLHALGFESLSLGVFGFALAYTVLWFALDPGVRFNPFNRIGDYSYGLYIYSFPIQQTIVHFDKKIGVLQLFALSFGLTLILAVLSWHLLERPALNLKGNIGFDRLLGYLFPWIQRRPAVGIEQVDLSGPLLKVNQRLCEMLGYTSDELLQRSFRDITHPDDLAQEERLLADLVGGRVRSYYIEKRYLHKDGGAVPVRVTSSQVHKSEANGRYRISIVESIEDNSRHELGAPGTISRYLEFNANPPGSWIGNRIRRMLPRKIAELDSAVGRALEECLTYRREVQAGRAVSQRFGTR